MPTWRHRQYFFTLPCFIVKFSYWSKFHVNIMTGSGSMTIFVYKGLTWNLEIGNTPVWVLPNICRLGQVRNTKICTNMFNEKLLNTAKCQGYSFYRFWVIEQKPTGRILPPPPRLGLNLITVKQVEISARAELSTV